MKTKQITIYIFCKKLEYNTFDRKYNQPIKYSSSLISIYNRSKYSST